MRDHFRERAAEYNAVVFDNGRANTALNGDVFDLDVVAPDLVYLDPPYAPPRDDNDYIKQYHFLEGLSVYWRGMTIMTETKTKKLAKRFTPFAYKRTIEDALLRTFEHFESAGAIVLSYSSNAIPDADRIVDLLGKVKPSVETVAIDHRYSFGTHSAAARPRRERVPVHRARRMSAAVSFDEYRATLGRLTGHVDPTASSREADDIRNAARDLAALPTIDAQSLTTWVEANPRRVPVLGLVLGLGQERLKNALKHRFDTSGWMTLARTRPGDLISWLDTDFDLVRLLSVQQRRRYGFADVLIARAGSRLTATRAGESGRNGRTAPCDLVIPDSGAAEIVVAAKGVDFTGSKLTDAVREIEEMAACGSHAST